MATLILTLNGEIVAEYRANKERYTIGRLADNDIRIDHPEVSDHHSLIITVLNESFLEDLNSYQGTYVNGKLIKQHTLQYGDVIKAGLHELMFVEDEETQQGECEKIVVIHAPPRDLAPPVDMVPAAFNDEGAPGASRKARLQVLSGASAGRALELTKVLTKLSRLGVRVAAITRRAEGYFIAHVDGESGRNVSLVNGAAIGAQARKLTHNDMIQLVDVKMQFVEC
jgi:hypothetical protein